MVSLLFVIASLCDYSHKYRETFRENLFARITKNTVSAANYYNCGEIKHFFLAVQNVYFAGKDFWDRADVKRSSVYFCHLLYSFREIFYALNRVTEDQIVN